MVMKKYVKQMINKLITGNVVKVGIQATWDLRSSITEQLAKKISHQYHRCSIMLNEPGCDQTNQSLSEEKKAGKITADLN